MYFSEKHFRSGGEENERQMENNAMQEMRVYGGYLVCIDLAQISPATAPEILPATSYACVGFSLEEETVMQQSRSKYFPQFENQGINTLGDNTQIT